MILSYFYSNSKLSISSFVLLFSFFFVKTTFCNSESSVVDLSVVDYNEFLENNSNLTILKFYASWCGHCKALKPIYEEAANILIDHGVSLGKLDCESTDAAKQICQQHKITGYPTLKVYQNGQFRDYTGDRSTASIVDFVKRLKEPVIKNVDVKQDLDELVKKHNVVVALEYDSLDNSNDEAEFEKISQVFEKIANNNRDSYTFAKYEIKDNRKDTNDNTDKTPKFLLALYKIDNDGKIQKIGYKPNTTTQNNDQEITYNENDIVKFIKRRSKPIIDEIGPSNFEEYVSDDTPLAYILVNNTEDRKVYEQKLLDLALETQDKIKLVILNATLYGGYAGNLNLEEGFPSFAIETHRPHGKFPLLLGSSNNQNDNKLTSEKIIEHINKFLENKLEPSVKSQEIPAEEYEDNVRILVAKNFNEIVINNEKDVFVEFYAPWCGHCKSLAPIWSELAKLYKENNKTQNIVIAKMDATDNDLPYGSDFEIEGFPTLKLFRKCDDKNQEYKCINKKKAIVDYNGDRSLEALTEFLRHHAYNNADVSVPQIESEDESEEFDEDEEDHDEL